MIFKKLIVLYSYGLGPHSSPGWKCLPMACCHSRCLYNSWQCPVFHYHNRCLSYRSRSQQPPRSSKLMKGWVEIQTWLVPQKLQWAIFKVNCTYSRQVQHSSPRLKNCWHHCSTFRCNSWPDVVCHFPSSCTSVKHNHHHFAIQSMLENN